MPQTYSIHEFAELAGVTVKALRHYDRLGLLCPQRSGTAGYRRYHGQDLERLEQIVALKFLGVPLKQIGELLNSEPSGFRKTLQMQRRAVEEKQALLDRAVRVLRAADEAIQAGEAAAPAMLKKIIEVIQMQDGVEAMKKYYTKESWEKRRRYYEDGPSEEWHQLYRDIGAALDEDPGGEHAQALADRWLDLSIRAMQGDERLQSDSPTAWMDRENWPPVMKERLAKFNLEAIHAFILKTATAARKKYFEPAAWERFVALQEDRDASVDSVSAIWQKQVDLFKDVETSIAEPPSSTAAQALAARWRALLTERSFGDAGIENGLDTAWRDRNNWPPRLRWQFEGMCMMSYERILKCGAFLDAARAAQTHHG